MPLPAYMTQQPNQIDAVSRRMAGMGIPATIVLKGQTILMSGIEPDQERKTAVRRAIEMACDLADSTRCSIEVMVPTVDSSIVETYEQFGFRVVMEVDEEDETGPHVLIRRFARRLAA